ncbi:MAG TPA: hypothetical protein ENI23_11750 [bacterium]|nr:hypothetical protein [bacterium]
MRIRNYRFLPKEVLDDISECKTSYPKNVRVYDKWKKLMDDGVWYVFECEGFSEDGTPDISGFRVIIKRGKSEDG